MKTLIRISGQISGNFTLRNAIITAECEEKKGMFNSIILTFPTKKDAVIALSKGRRYIRNNEPNLQFPLFGYLRGSILNYDASSAKIVYE